MAPLKETVVIGTAGSAPLFRRIAFLLSALVLDAPYLHDGIGLQLFPSTFCCAPGLPTILERSAGNEFLHEFETRHAEGITGKAGLIGASHAPEQKARQR